MVLCNRQTLIGIWHLERVTDADGDENGFAQVEHGLLAALRIGDLAGRLVDGAGEEADLPGDRIRNPRSPITTDDEIRFTARSGTMAARERDPISGIRNLHPFMKTEFCVAGAQGEAAVEKKGKSFAQGNFQIRSKPNH